MSDAETRPREVVQHSLPAMRLGLYGFAAAAGVLLSFYQPLSIRKASELVQSSIHVVLLMGAVLAIGGMLTRWERVERSGLCMMIGPLVAYVALITATAKANPLPDRYATLAVGCMLAISAWSLLILCVDLHREIRRADAERRRRAAEPAEPLPEAGV